MASAVMLLFVSLFVPVFALFSKSKSALLSASVLTDFYSLVREVCRISSSLLLIVLLPAQYTQYLFYSELVAQRNELDSEVVGVAALSRLTGSGWSSSVCDGTVCCCFGSFR